MLNRPGLNLAFGALCLLALQGCSPAKQGAAPGESATSYLSDGKDKVLPHNPLIDGAFPLLRQDTFYKTYRTAGGKTVSLDDRFVSNGRGFVSYCENNSSAEGDPVGTGDGFTNGYYLYNFYGHSSFFVTIRDRTYKVAMTSPGDDLIRAYQMLYAAQRNKPLKGEPAVTRLGPKTIDGLECIGVSYTDNDGSKHEEWFESKSRRLIDQVVEREGEKLSRHLKRFNENCETMLLRLPEGFTLLEASPARPKN
ncbi:MAG: hypothetical protein JSS83_28510 [Cyanobacteria bacterium SZAS LIN-3]|nr:hypothetical protein [Cyanobacteria bacterium SZAS LIN-3]